MTDTQPKPLTKDEIASVKLSAAKLNGRLTHKTVFRLIATIEARDAEIKRLRKVGVAAEQLCDRMLITGCAWTDYSVTVLHEALKEFAATEPQ